MRVLNLLTRVSAALGRFAAGVTKADYSQYGGVETLLDIGFGGSGTAGLPRSTSEWVKTFLTHARLHPAVNRIATDCARTELLLLRDDPLTGHPQLIEDGQGLTEELRELKTFLENPWRTGGGGSWATLAWLSAVYYELDGNVFWLMRRSPGSKRPREVWPVPPHWVTHIPTKRAPYFQITMPWEEIPTSVPPGEMVWFRRVDPRNPFARGVGVAHAADDEVTQDEWAAKYNAAWFKNGGRPDILISGSKIKGEGDEKRLREQWNQRYKGFWNAFKVAFINDQTQVHLLTTKHADMQWLEGRRFHRDTIFQLFGLPPEIMGVVENSNRATAEAALYIYSLQVILPRLCFFVGELNRLLVPIWDRSVYLGFESPVRETEEFKLEKAVELFKSGAITRDECREATGFDPVGGDKGEEFLQPTNMVAVQVKAAEASAVDQVDQVEESFEDRIDRLRVAMGNEPRQPGKVRMLKVVAPDGRGSFREFQVLTRARGRHVHGRRVA